MPVATERRSNGGSAEQRLTDETSSDEEMEEKEDQEEQEVAEEVEKNDKGTPPAREGRGRAQKGRQSEKSLPSPQSKNASQGSA